MEFKDIQQKVVENAIRYGKEYNVKIDQDFALIKLYEEVGEFSQAVLIHMVIVNAHLFGIDLEEAIEKKWISKE